jgi:M6 family metalloprotease-like protein
MFLMTVPVARSQAVAARKANGILQTIVLPVEFSDLKHTSSISDLQSTALRLSQYYANASFGAVSVNVTVYSSWIALTHPMSYYGADKSVGDDQGGNPNGSEQLLTDAVAAAGQNYDLGRWTYLIVAHAGQDQAQGSPSAASPLIWSRTWIGNTFLPRGTDAGSIVSESSPLGIWTHEFGHQIGHLPDMYSLKDSSLHFMGVWSLMDLGAYLGDPEGTQPGLLDAWSRIGLGWINATAAPQGNYTLIPAELPPNQAPVSCCYALEVPLGHGAYYLIELRLRTGIDSAQPTGGVILYLYNSSAIDGQLRVVDINQPSLPARSDLSDASLSPGQSFADPNREFSLRIVSASAGYYTLSISSKISYSLSIVAPRETNILENRTAYVVVDPPVIGYNLAVSLDNSSVPILMTVTKSLPDYNFTFAFSSGQAGNHIIGAVLTDANGQVLATTSYSLKANVPPWISLLQPQMIWLYVAIGVAALIGVSFYYSFRESSREQDTAQPLKQR